MQNDFLKSSAYWKPVQGCPCGQDTDDVIAAALEQAGNLCHILRLGIPNDFSNQFHSDSQGPNLIQFLIWFS